MYAAIRRDHRMGMSLRALQRTHNVTWRTVRRALDGQWPEPRKKQRRKESRLDPYKPLIDGMLLADLDAPPKQRHTAQRIYDRLVEDHAADDISYSMVRVYVKDRRKEVRRQAGVGPDAMFVPQTHLPGAEAEVDFGDVHVMLAGKMTKVYLFSMRLSYSGKAVHRVFASCGQEAFFEGHVHAFRVLGGTPRGRIRYDNLWRTTAGRPFARTGASMPSTAVPASKAPMRRAASKARSATTGATTSSPSPRSPS
ncbi:IstA2 [Streptomyces malaysiensis subsp. malaysiensis]|nr:IstA2 [Streptomyces malaysiensis]